MALTGKQRRVLRALGHHLDPVVIVGQLGITPGIVTATEQALFDHELIKVKFNEGPVEREEGAAQLAQETGSEVAQVLGRTALLYKRHPDKPKIDIDGIRKNLPTVKNAGPTRPGGVRGVGSGGPRAPRSHSRGR